MRVIERVKEVEAMIEIKWFDKWWDDDCDKGFWETTEKCIYLFQSQKYGKDLPAAINSPPMTYLYKYVDFGELHQTWLGYHISDKDNEI